MNAEMSGTTENTTGTTTTTAIESQRTKNFLCNTLAMGLFCSVASFFTTPKKQDGRISYNFYLFYAIYGLTGGNKSRRMPPRGSLSLPKLES